MVFISPLITRQFKIGDTKLHTILNMQKCISQKVAVVLSKCNCANQCFLMFFTPKSCSFLPQSTVHGLCSTEHVVNARMDIATDVTLSRDLSQCDQFYSRELVSSPLAVLQKLVRHYPSHSDLLPLHYKRKALPLLYP